MELSKVKHNIGTLLGRPRREHFLRRMPRGGVGAEVGVFRGELTRHILNIARPRELHLIDAWWELYGEYFPDWGAYTDHGRLATRDAYAEVEQIVSRHSRGAKCEIHVGDDCEVLAGFSDDYFDWVYLDSSHQYEDTLRELNVLEAKVKPGGLITGDDWVDDPSNVNHGASVAIREFCEQRGWRIDEIDQFGQWQISQHMAA